MAAKQETFDIGKTRGKRVDFKAPEFDLAVQTKGYRIFWSRALLCPCRLNATTEQANPLCIGCSGDGYFYENPDPTGPILDIYTCLDPPFLDRTEDKGPWEPPAKPTQLILTHVTRDPQIFEKFGEWVFGSCNFTTFSFHRVGYRDRLEMVDATMLYNQFVTMPEGDTIGPGRRDTGLRYKVVNIVKVVEVDPKTFARTDHTAAATVNADGTVTFSPPPSPGTLLAVAYDMNPIWIVMDHIYSVRDTPIAFKTTNPLGVPTVLPHHGMAKLDFLIGPDTS